MGMGVLVADSVMVALIEEQLQSVENRAPLLFDGFPRTFGVATAPP